MKPLLGYYLLYLEILLIFPNLEEIKDSELEDGEDSNDHNVEPALSRGTTKSPASTHPMR
jgi:hypothetical protein